MIYKKYLILISNYLKIVQIQYSVINHRFNMAAIIYKRQNSYYWEKVFLKLLGFFDYYAGSCMIYQYC